VVFTRTYYTNVYLLLYEYNISVDEHLSLGRGDGIQTGRSVELILLVEQLHRLRFESVSYLVFNNIINDI